MGNTAKVTTVLAIFASEAAKIKEFQTASYDLKMQTLGIVSALLEDRYDLLEDEIEHEEFEKRFYNSIVVPWCDLDSMEEE